MRDLVTHHVVINALRAVDGISSRPPWGSRGNLDYVLLQREGQTIAQAIARPLSGHRPHHARLKLRGGVDARRLPLEAVGGLEITGSGVVIVEEHNIAHGVRLIEHLAQVSDRHAPSPTRSNPQASGAHGSSPPTTRGPGWEGPSRPVHAHGTGPRAQPTRMLNPWADLPTAPPFVASADAEFIRRYPKPAASLRLDLLPSPYLGKPDAPVLLLLLNPGGQHNDFKYGPDFVQERRRALSFESTHCFWSLDPGMAGTEAYKYAKTRMRALIDVVGQERVAQRMMWLQYLGYQSLEWQPFPITLPSQQFAFSLLREAMQCGKVVVIGRSRQLWVNAVPELAYYDYIELRNPRSPYLTLANMGPAGFTRIVEALND